MYTNNLIEQASAEFHFCESGGTNIRGESGIAGRATYLVRIRQLTS